MVDQICMLQNTETLIQLQHRFTKNPIRQDINIHVGLFNMFKILLKTIK